MIDIKSYSKQPKNTALHAPTNTDILSTINDIEANITSTKDAALIHYTKQFDHVSSDNFSLVVTEQERKDAYNQVSTEFLDAIKEAKANITAFHENQVPFDWDETTASGYTYGMQYQAIDIVGLYVPGGRALYPSTILMNAIPANLAGVSHLVMTTPPQKNGTLAPEILVTANECNIQTIIKAGGAQSIFALAYGTESVPKVDKIVGPGNQYVDLAKQRVYGLVDIDKPAGPSEVLVYIEDPTYAPYAAAELLAQLEHDPNASAQAISPDLTCLELIQKELTSQFKDLKRQDIITQSITNANLLHVSNQEEGIVAMNDIASEHLVLCVDEPELLRLSIKHAGAIFCGPYTPVAVGDYYAGPNHVLPTARAARFSSALSVMDFMKFSSHVTFTKEALQQSQQTIKILTHIESLDAHYQSIIKRLNT